jgi:hypothetical protein
MVGLHGKRSIKWVVERAREGSPSAAERDVRKPVKAARCRRVGRG